MRLLSWMLAPLLLMAAEPPAPKFFLPDSVRPTDYKLDLRIVPKEPVLTGTVTIDVEFRERTSFLWLNARDLTVRAARLADGTSLRAVASGNEFIGLELPAPAGPGKSRVVIDYSAAVSDKENAGPFRRQWRGDWYVFTTFTPIEARRAFPCFDEPRFKTPWQLTLHVERSQVAASNTRIVSETPEPDGMKKVVFAATLPLPSEVVAFTVGPFDVVQAGVAGQRHVAGPHSRPRGRASEARAAAKATAGIVASLEKYTGMAYPWDKLDHVALPESAYGAVENPGLITYREKILLGPNEKSMRSTMTHEVAHQWFGNLVTQANWSDVWLSEGFATWLASKLTGPEPPEFTEAKRPRPVRSDDELPRRDEGCVRAHCVSQRRGDPLDAGSLAGRGSDAPRGPAVSARAHVRERHDRRSDRGSGEGNAGGRCRCCEEQLRPAGHSVHSGPCGVPARHGAVAPGHSSGLRSMGRGRSAVPGSPSG